MPYPYTHLSQERANPDLLSKTVARRRRVALASGYSEAEVTTMMAAFTQMRSQMVNMSRMMKLGTAEGKRE
jgi:signal recognition particle subunit SRP54